MTKAELHSFLQFPRDFVDEAKYNKTHLIEVAHQCEIDRFRPALDQNVLIINDEDWGRIRDHFNALNVHFDEKVRLGEILDALENDPEFQLNSVLISPTVHLFGKDRKLTLERVIQHLSSTLTPLEEGEKDYQNIYSWNEFKKLFTEFRPSFETKQLYGGHTSEKFQENEEN